MDRNEESVVLIMGPWQGPQPNVNSRVEIWHPKQFNRRARRKFSDYPSNPSGVGLWSRCPLSLLLLHDRLNISRRGRYSQKQPHLARASRNRQNLSSGLVVWSPGGQVASGGTVVYRCLFLSSLIACFWNDSVRSIG